MTPRSKRVASALVAALAAVTMLGTGSAAAKSTPAPRPVTTETNVADTGAKVKDGPGGAVFTRSFKPRR